MVGVRCTVSALTRKIPLAACIKFVFNSIVTTLRSAGSPDRAATAIATSIKVSNTPPCATSQVFVNSGLIASTISPFPNSEERHRTPNSFRKGTSSSSPRFASLAVAVSKVSLVIRVNFNPSNVNPKTQIEYDQLWNFY